MFEFLTPDVFDLLVIGNLVVGALIAGWRFRRDLRHPLPDEAPAWARGEDSKGREIRDA